MAVRRSPPGRGRPPRRARRAPGPRRRGSRSRSSCALRALLRLALSWTALECLERAQLVPRLFVRLGLRETESSRIGLDDPLPDADVDRTALDACGPTLTPEAQIALRERVRG